jgi:ribose/xylose/arabinose/galactoside ABC-type transport system permease subunit
MVVLFTMGNRNFLSISILLIVGLGQMSAILIGGIDLSVGGLMSFISVLFVISLKAVGFWAFPFCIVAGIVVGFINGNILTRIKIPSFIATLGTGGILTSVALLVSPLPVDVPAPRHGMLIS